MEFIKYNQAFEVYLQDESRLSGHGDFFAFPENINELAAALKKAEAEGLPVTIQGALTGIAGGAVPQGGLVINLTKMNRLSGLHFSDEGLVLRAEAGATLSQIEEALLSASSEIWQTGVSEDERKSLRSKSFFLAPSPTEKTASIGGLFACNAGGIHSLAFGRTGAQVWGLSWLTMKGELWRIRRGEFIFDSTGCNLPKGGRLDCLTSLEKSPIARLIPHEGMDLIDFLAGSEGLLGVGAELEIVLREQAEELWGVLFFFESEDVENAFLPELYKLYRANAESLISCEYYDPSALKIMSENKEGFSALKNFPDFPVAALSALYVELEGSDEQALNEQLFQLLELFLLSGGQEEQTWAASGIQEMEKFRTLRHSIPELVNTEIDKARQDSLNIRKTAGDFSSHSDDFFADLRAYQNDLRKLGLPHCLFGHLFENHFHVNFMPKNDEQAAKSLDLLDDFAEKLVSKGGNIAAENGVGKLKEQWLSKFLTDEYKEHFKAIIRAFKEM